MNSLSSLNDPLLTSPSARSRLNLPDIPTDVTVYLGNDLNDVANQMSLSDGDQSELRSVLQTLRASGLRTPLLAALMISPFVWFLSNQLWKAAAGLVDPNETQEQQQQSTPPIDSTEVALQNVADPSPSTSMTTVATAEIAFSPEATSESIPLKRSDRLLEKQKLSQVLLLSPAEATVSSESEEPGSKRRRPPKRKAESVSTQRKRTVEKKLSKLSQRDIIIKEGGTAWNPIDVDKLTASSSEITVEAQATVRSEDNLERFGNSVQCVHDNFINAASFHYTDPPRSVFHSLSIFQFNQQSVTHLQEFFRIRHLVVRDTADDRFLFDARGLSSLEKLSSVITVYEFEHRFNEIAREGTLKQLLESTRTDGKILSAMSVPMYSVAMVSGPLFSETAAWKATNCDAYCRDDGQHEDPMPVGDMRRGMAAIHGSLKWWNIETDGLASMIEVKTGLIYIIVFRPSGTKEGSLRGMKPDFEEFYAQWSGKKPFEPPEDPVQPPVCEGICLPKGDRIYLRPNTPHMIYFAADSICHVSHFYATSTMQDSFVAILQSFVLGEHISDAARPRTRRFIQRLIHFYHRSYVQEKVPEDDDEDLGHLPHLNTYASVFDVVAVCVLGILANVLDPRTYVYPGQKTDSTLTDEAKTAVDTGVLYL
ncbi:hypothetical protein NLJ89_g10004 [Agrocybe chaxingu]|uniref:JmjC domain-containing protein n=1 Tax=Agrocybe chaxingu TaxID=84603 RepID=A0A9W8JRE6_9AGAR|nr:hypothetical protein NLJ89_g10004 [Agrocybe chaxingu]